MNMHTTSSEIQQYGFGAHMNLALIESGWMSIIVHGSICSILSAMENEHNSEIGTLICANLMHLASIEGNRDLIALNCGIGFT